MPPAENCCPATILPHLPCPLEVLHPPSHPPHAEEERRCEAVIQGLQQMADKMQQAVNLEGMREVEAVLAPLPPPQVGAR